MDLGILGEGVVELDPMTGRMVFRIQQEDGSNSFLDVQEHMMRYLGEEVRFVVTPLRTVAELAQMVESGELSVEELPTVPRYSV